MTGRVQVPWPDARLFARRNGRPYRILAVADEIDRSLESPATRAGLGPIDLVIGCGDLPVDYLQFVTDAFDVQLAYVRGNHDVGGAWATGDATRLHLPEPLEDGRPWTDGAVTVIGFSGIPQRGGSGLQVSSLARWSAVLGAWLRVGRRGPGDPMLCISHVAPRGINDGPDRFHQGSRALRWLAERLAPPLWLHGHTTLLTRRLEDRCIQRGRTLFYNTVGAILVELVPPEQVRPAVDEEVAA